MHVAKLPGQRCPLASECTLLGSITQIVNIAAAPAAFYTVSQKTRYRIFAITSSNVNRF